MKSNIASNAMFCASVLYFSPLTPGLVCPYTYYVHWVSENQQPNWKASKLFPRNDADELQRTIITNKCVFTFLVVLRSTTSSSSPESKNFTNITKSSLAIGAHFMVVLALANIIILYIYGQRETSPTPPDRPTNRPMSEVLLNYLHRN